MIRNQSDTQNIGEVDIQASRSPIRNRTIGQSDDLTIEKSDHRTIGVSDNRTFGFQFEPKSLDTSLI